jgi:hypothetical protein
VRLARAITQSSIDLRVDHEVMRHQQHRSLKYEYELYVEREIEDYKDSIPRSAILSIGDEAVGRLRAQEQVAFDELVLWDEVDRIITSRLRIPTYATWKRRRLRLLAEYRRPEHWGMQPDAPLVRAIPAGAESRVLVSGPRVSESTLYLAANGCTVTAVGDAPEVVERVLIAAEAVGLASQVTAFASPLSEWAPDGPLTAVVVSPAAFAGLSDADRARVIEVLKGATLDGGVHLVDTIIAGHATLSLEELRSQYRGWAISVERGGTTGATFLARKAAVAAS